MRRGAAALLAVLALPLVAHAAPSVKRLGIDLPSRPGWSRDGSWFGVAQADKVVRYDRSGQPLPSWPIKTKVKSVIDGVPSVSPDGERVVFQADVRGQHVGPIALFVLTVATGKLEALFDPKQKPLSQMASGLWLADGRALFVVNNQLFSYSATSGKLDASFCADVKQIHAVALSADDQHLALLTGDSRLFIAGSDCSHPGRSISRGAESVAAFSFAPDAGHIAVSYALATSRQTLWVSHLDGSQAVQVMPEADVTRPAWLGDDVLVFNAAPPKGSKHGLARAIYTYTVSTGVTAVVPGTEVKTGYANEVVSAPRQGGAVLYHGSDGKLGLIVPGPGPAAPEAPKPGRVDPPVVGPMHAPSPPGGTFSDQTGTAKGYLFSTWASGSERYIVGDKGGRHSSDGGQTWTPFLDGTLLFVVWGSGPDDVYVCGRGVIQRSTDHGATWQELVPKELAHADFFGLWGAGKGELTVVGGDTVLHTSDGGTTWQRARPVPSAVLRDVWGSGPGNVYLATEAGDILHLGADGKRWVVQRKAETGHDLVRLWGSGPHDIYASGFGPTLVHSSDGATWTDLPPPAVASSSITDVWGTGPDDVYCLGNAALMHSSDGGASWQTVAGIPSGMYVISVGGSRHDLWVLGLDRILRGPR